MNFDDASKMKKCNDALRQEIIEEARKMSSNLERFAFICSKFLSEYEFDYSALRAMDEPDFRNLREKRFTYDGHTYFGVTNKLFDFIENHDKPVCPSIHALKMGTCVYFSREIEVFAEEFGVEYEHIERDMLCYDGYEKLKAEDRIRVMNHHYTILTIDGKKYKVDIAGGLMAEDYRREHEGAKIKAEQFVLTTDLDTNAFDEIVKEKKEPGEDE